MPAKRHAVPDLAAKAMTTPAISKRNLDPAGKDERAHDRGNGLC
jgi:hypothetical protein